MTGAPAVDDLWALELAKARHAAQGAGDEAGGAAGGFWPAALLGLAAWARTILTTPRGDPLPANASLLAALHGELSNRTRHLIGLLAREAPGTPILLLGRPQLPLPALRQALAKEGLPGASLVRPFDLAAALAAAPAILRRLNDGARATRQASWRPPPRELAAICFRMMLGETQAAWIRRTLGVGPRTVIFGHTGVADSHLLERALQARGARTIHWVHGVSLGLNFVAGSDLGLFQCGADARWHQALGGYGLAAALPLPAPDQATGGEGWLLLSNLVHPMNPRFRRDGVAGEAALLEQVAAAAAIAGQTRLVWKPHPILRTLPAEVRDAIEARAAALGFSRWPHQGGDLARAKDFQLVLSTPSTVAIDMLRLGGLPLIVGGEDLDPMSAIAQFPLRAGTIEEIAAAARRLSDPAERSDLFAQAWAAVAPAAPPTLADILGLAARAADG
ncbi:MAG: hypothetical protein KF842_03595 [Caulobacter sp.]|nr:hypothetical protein [Caulobacter sp.]